VPLATVVDAACGPALRRAIAAHPSLRITAAEQRPALSVSCPRDEFPAAVASPARAHVRVLLGSSQTAVATPAWTPYAGDRANPALSAAWLAAARWPDPVTAARDRILLDSADMPLVVLRDQGAEPGIPGAAIRFVDTVVDVRQSLFVRQPEFAAFVGALVDLASGRQLLTESVSVSRDPGASRVIPAALDARSGGAPARPRVADEPLSFMFVLAALLILVLDTGLYARARRGAKNA